MSTLELMVQGHLARMHCRASLPHRGPTRRRAPRTVKVGHTMNNARSDPLVIDGSYGESGGQILRTALSLSCITQRHLRVERIRAGRPHPGLAAQHLTAIRASAALTRASLDGDVLGSGTLQFCPRISPAAGVYRFDVADAREGGSAGAATLVLQTVTLPLALAGAESSVTAVGGTHVPWSPSYDYFETVWLESLRGLGLNATSRLIAWGFYPAGGGEVALRVGKTQTGGQESLSPLRMIRCGELRRIEGRAVAASLPSHIAQRMADRARALLLPLGVPVTIETQRPSPVSPGAWIFLRAIYDSSAAGFGALGARGKPSEEVAEDAVAELLEFHGSGAAVDRYLADQILLPLCFAGGPSDFTCSSVSQHLETNAWVIEQCGLARIAIDRGPGKAGHVTVTPAVQAQSARRFVAQ